MCNSDGAEKYRSPMFVILDPDFTDSRSVAIQYFKYYVSMATRNDKERR